MQEFIQLDTGLRNQEIRVSRRLINVSSTLLHWSGFKRNLIQVAFFYVRAGDADGIPCGICSGSAGADGTRGGMWVFR